MALLPTIPRVGHWNGGTSVAMGCPVDCGPSERLKHFVERCGKMWKDVERFCGEIRRVTRCHTCETCETCETVYLHFLQLSHPRPILAVKWRRKEIRPEDYLVSMNAVSNNVAHKQLGEQLAHTAYI